MGPVNQFGYGCFVYNGKKRMAHLLAYELLKESIPPKVKFRHICSRTNYRPCVNPDHLILITRREKERKTRKPIDHISLFWKKVKKSEGCWEWQGCLSGGYGSVTVNKQCLRAHRFVWTFTFGAIPDGLFVCHHCDNRRCVRPDHLFLGTTDDNMRDMVIKGRHHPPIGEKHGSRTKPERVARGERHGSRIHPEKTCRGEQHGGSKLTLDDVHKIRAFYSNGDKKIKELAAQFYISRPQVARIVKNQLWKDL